MKKIKNKLVYTLTKFILLVKNFKPEDSIIIFSEPRGGSTWLMELLNKIPNTVTNWEPLHHKKGVVPKKFNWSYRIFLSENDNSNNYLSLMNDILSLKRFTWWTINKNSLIDILKGKLVITKFIQGNLLLPWLTKNINFRYKPIYLLRHPISTSLSQNKMWGLDTLDKFKIPKTINNERFVNHKSFIDNLETNLQRQVALWCINNKYVLEHKFHHKKWLTIYYEDLVLNPIEELNKIFKEFNLKNNDIILDNIRKPSKTTLGKELNDKPKSQIEKFLSVVNNKELVEIQKIFDYFNIKNYSAFSAYPTNITKN